MMGFKQREESLKERIENFSSYSTAERTFAKIGYDVGFIDGKQQSGWQPIETAPKDGTKIIGSAFPFGVSNATAMKYIEASYPRLTGWYDVNQRWREPTHWMPLPSPPTDNSHRQGGSNAE